MASAACCRLSPVSHDYQPKGRWETIGGIKTYVVGSETADKAVIGIYDIFGPAPQILQGLDRVAAQTSSLVLLPDLFAGNYIDPALFPPDTDEKMGKIYAFIGGQGNPAANLDKTLAFRREVGVKWPQVEEHIGILGLCWGGKIAVLASGEGNEGKGRKVTVSGSAHPSLLDAKDAEALNVPHILLPAPEDDPAAVEEYKKIIPAKGGVVEVYETMFHGWMAARANLQDEQNAKEYERGYTQMSEFFVKHL